ncbi:PP2C family protein-serine/threonine phosphatase [Halalkalibacter alkaliphilus]|uniref:Protein phosphatase 2C domain-containing protein n=1 Tax=Halalkalibacter alkaliphilus TaxID=2917993 RepID=A0A9X2CU69_9BACI|nr:protein phosphatase 2C domain-containing protein [Halalkalibacter alkaliphilus]MCL7748019.1 protein phosphatase 2C domain-containing protein [Halalkalibacter alkaliphilus]
MTNKKAAWEYGLSTHKGAVKQINEDNALLKIASDSNGCEASLVIVADGMGGYQAGDVASQLVIDQLNDWWERRIRTMLKLRRPFKSIAKEIESLLHETNHKLIGIGNKEGSKLGTTVSVLFLYQNRYLICHIGDSRIYRFDEDLPRVCSDNNSTYPLESDTVPLGETSELVQLTEDHSWVEQQVKLGLLTKEQAASHPRRNVLLQCLGIENEVEPFIKEGSYKANDLFLLCSDGFYTLFSNEAIVTLLTHSEQKYNDLQQVSDHLVDLSNREGATDNVTVLLIRPLESNVKKGWKSMWRNLFP